MRNDVDMNCGGCEMNTENLSQKAKEESSVSFGEIEKLELRGMLYDFYGELLTSHQKKVYEDAMMQENQGYYGTPPECIIISFGFSQKNDYWKPIAKKEAVFRYSSQGLKSVSLDTVPDYTENGMYHKEAYAELSYQENGIAFMMIQFGKRYARCYRYDIIKNEKNIQLINEKLIWVS